jgi:hypothetical protein
MRLVAVLLIAALTGCAHAPWKDNYAVNGQIPDSYNKDKGECTDQAWRSAKEESRSVFGGTFTYFFGKYLDECMKGKGYERVTQPSGLLGREYVAALQVGSP